jgi:hypothetical protein
MKTSNDVSAGCYHHCGKFKLDFLQIALITNNLNSLIQPAWGRAGPAAWRQQWWQRHHGFGVWRGWSGGFRREDGLWSLDLVAFLLSSLCIARQEQLQGRKILWDRYCTTSGRVVRPVSPIIYPYDRLVSPTSPKGEKEILWDRYCTIRSSEWQSCLTGFSHRISVIPSH